jgi:hypothetical protein
MSPSVITLPVRNFKFLTEGSLERRRNYRFCEKTCLPSETGFRSVFLDGGTDGFQLADEPSSTDLIGFALATARYAQGAASRCQPPQTHCPVMGWRHSVGQALKLLLEIASLREGHG